VRQHQVKRQVNAGNYERNVPARLCRGPRPPIWDGKRTWTKEYGRRRIGG